jgi:AcrR family transcriptional regulator
MAPRIPVPASGSGGGKPLRADALRNRAKVLAAAEAVFAEQGTSASTEEIARTAGVGIGTVFRHFPTKESLLEAVLNGLLQRLAEEADALAAADDPGAAFFTFFTQVVTQATTKNDVSQALEEAGIDAKNTTEQTGQELRKALDTLLGRAQRAGAIRHDIGLAEVMTLLAATSRSAEHTSGDRDVRSKTLEIVFDGLRHR